MADKEAADQIHFAVTTAKEKSNQKSQSMAGYFGKGAQTLKQSTTIKEVKGTNRAPKRSSRFIVEGIDKGACVVVGSGKANQDLKRPKIRSDVVRNVLVGSKLVNSAIKIGKAKTNNGDSTVQDIEVSAHGNLDEITAIDGVKDTLGLDGENNVNSNLLTENDMENPSYEEIINADGSLTITCKECGIALSRRDNLKRHLKRKHNIQLTSKVRSTTCTHPGCTETFYHRGKLFKHLETAHQIKLNIQMLKFGSEDEFMSWKEKEELTNYVYFSKQRGEKEASLVRNLLFNCQFDGGAEPHRKRGEPGLKTGKSRKIGRVKTGKFCPARIVANINKSDNSVSVEYVSSHSHPISIANTVFHPIPKRIKTEIKEKLALGISVKEVYQNLREGLSNRDSGGKSAAAITKVQLISKSNISEIKRKMKFGSRLDADDSVSTYTLVKKLQNEKYSSVMVFKPQGKPTKTGSKIYDDVDVNNDLFALGIQTEKQLEMFIQAAPKYLFIDSTYKSNAFDFPLTTIMAPDEYNKGFPVGFFVSNYEDEITLLPFFEEIKKRCPEDFKVNCVMTDDQYSGGTAFTNVFGECKHIISPLHVMRAWRKNLKLSSSEYHDEIYQSLLLMMNERDKTDFVALCYGFINQYSLVASDFVTYFQENFIETADQWAMCYRDLIPVQDDTNLYMEEYGNTLKNFFNEERPNKRVDDLINLLLTIEEEVFRKWKSLRMPSSVTINYQSRHERGMLVSDTVIKKGFQDEWKIHPQKQGDFVYTVKKLMNYCLDEDCLNRCTEIECIGLCEHIYSCDCEDRSRMCEHVHKIHSMKLTADSSNFQAPPIQKEVVVGNDETLPDEEESLTEADIADISLEQEENSVSKMVQNDPNDADLIKFKENIEKLCLLAIDPKVRKLKLQHINKQVVSLIKKCENVASLSFDITAKKTKPCLDKSLQVKSKSKNVPDPVSLNLNEENIDQATIEQVRDIEKEIADAFPLVGEKKDISVLSKDYSDDDEVYQAKLKDLYSRYTKIRKTRGDGNCFYRGFGFRALETCLTDSTLLERLV